MRLVRLVLLLFLAFGFFPVLWALPPSPVSHAAQPEAKEYELKAVYLYNFLQFLQWPDAKRPTSWDNILVIGIVGDSPFGDALVDLEKNVRQSGMRPVRFVYIVSSDDHMPDNLEMVKCDLVFLASSEQDRFAGIIASLGNAPVLTVADSDDFLASGGMINLVHSNGKIRWAINRNAVEKAGLRMSAQLLSMAIKVHN